MKLYTYLLLTTLSLLSLDLKAQAPNEINYQGVARNSSGTVLSNQLIGLEFTIHQGSSTGTIVYQETQTDSTDQFGLFSVAIGAGTVKSGTFASINWGNNSEYLQVGMDPNGGTNYVDMGTQQFLSVPYALYAANSGNTSANAWQLVGNDVAYTFSAEPSTYLGTISSGGTGFQFGVNGNNAGRVEGGATFNSALGYQALNSNSSGTKNSALGAKALSANTTGSENSALGYNANVGSGTLINATVIGANATAIASNSITLGNSTATSLYLPGYSTIGEMFYTSAASGLVSPLAIGTSGQILTVSGGVPTWETSTGTSANAWQLTGNDVAYTFSSAPATYVGTASSGGAGFQFAVGGNNAGRIESTNQNTAIGYQSMNSNNTKINSSAKNTAVGFIALYSNTAQSGNIAIGDSAMYNQSYNSAFYSDNVALGNSALFQNNPTSTSNGYQNTAVGNNSLKANTSGFDNTAIGYDADLTSGGLSFATAIGAGAKAGQSNSLILGGASGTSSAVNVGIGTGTPNSTLQVSSGNISLPITVSSTSINLSTSPLTYTVIITATGQTVTLPVASTCAGRIYNIIAQMASGSITTSSYLNFNGVASTSIPAGNSIIIQSDGTNWDQIK